MCAAPKSPQMKEFWRRFMRKRTTSAQKYEFFTPPTCFPQRKFLLSHGSFI